MIPHRINKKSTEDHSWMCSHWFLWSNWSIVKKPADNAIFYFPLSAAPWLVPKTTGRSWIVGDGAELKCRLCNYFTTHRFSMKRHQRIHTGKACFNHATPMLKVSCLIALCGQLTLCAFLPTKCVQERSRSSASCAPRLSDRATTYPAICRLTLRAPLYMTGTECLRLDLPWKMANAAAPTSGTALRLLKNEQVGSDQNHPGLRREDKWQYSLTLVPHFLSFCGWHTRSTYDQHMFPEYCDVANR